MKLSALPLLVLVLVGAVSGQTGESLTASVGGTQIQISASPIETPSPSPSPSCSALPTNGEIDAGIDVETDLTCTPDSFDCVGTVCRYCRRSNTIYSAQLADCKTTPQKVSTMSAATRSGALAGLESIEKTSASNLAQNVGITMAAAAAVAAMAFATKQYTVRRTSPSFAPTPNSTNSSIAYRRGSVFHI